MALNAVQAPQGDLRASTGKLYYRVDETCSILSIGRTTLYRLISEGKLRTVKLYGATRITDDSIRTFAASLEQEAA